MLNKLIATLFVCLLSTTGCNIIYKQNVQQGNAIEQDKLDQLRMGMTMSQVAYLLGTPAIRDPFHQSRWDYVYTYARRGKNQVTRKVTLSFQDAVLVKMTGVSDEADQLQPVAADAGAGAVPAAVDSASDAAPQTQITPLNAPESDTIEDQAATDLPVTVADLQPPPQEETAESVESASTSGPAASTESFEPATAVDTHGDVAAVEDNSEWIIQVGAFESLQNARNLVNRLRTAGFNAVIYSQVVSGLGERFLVRTDSFPTRAEAERQLQQINQAFELGAFLVPPSP